MSRAIERHRGWRWVPDRLGYSIPFARGMWVWRFVGFGFFAAGAVVLGLVLHGQARPDVKPLSEAETRRLVLDRLAEVTLPAWQPGQELAPTDLPPFLSAPPAPLWEEPHPGDPPLDARAEEARGHFLGGETDPGRYLQAATLYRRAAQADPRSWTLRYNAGISLYQAGFRRDAAEFLEEAQDLLDGYATRYGGDTRHRAAMVANRYAQGLVFFKEDCIRSIRELKLAVRALKRYIDRDDAPVFDRLLPFRVEPTEIDNFDVWNILAEAYLACEGRYPREYFGRWSDAGSFREVEYSDPDAPAVQEGPFPGELAECIATDGSSSRCWALSNLNQLYLANRQLFPEEGGEAPAAFREQLPSLARLVYNIAQLAATGADRKGAVAQLQLAARLDRASPKSDLTGPIADLGRHLAPLTDNYAILAEPYVGKSVSQLPFGEETSAEAVKGMAWALSTGRWQGHLTSRMPERLMAEIDEAVQVIPGEHLSSLREWSDDVQEELRDALAEAIRLERRRGNLAAAMALRDFREDYLGEAWPDRADAAWRTWGMTAAAVGWGIVFVLLLAGWWFAYRYVVYPYLLYTTDYYKTEFHHRAAIRKKQGKPFTGREIQKWYRGSRAGQATQRFHSSGETRSQTSPDSSQSSGQ